MHEANKNDKKLLKISPPQSIVFSRSRPYLEHSQFLPKRYYIDLFLATDLRHYYLHLNTLAQENIYSVVLLPIASLGNYRGNPLEAIVHQLQKRPDSQSEIPN